LILRGADGLTSFWKFVCLAEGFVVAGTGATFGDSESEPSLSE
jgi:hypothetical protein